MDSLGTEVGHKMRSAIKAKLMELGCYVDDELPDYIMVMVANKRSRTQMEDDLQLFLRSDTKLFVEWLQQVLKKLKEVTITNPEVCGSFKELKRKAAMEIAECVIKKEKREKRIKTEKKYRSVEIVNETKSITDEIPVQATKLVEKRIQNNRGNDKQTNIQNKIVDEDSFDIPSLAEVNELEGSQLDLVESKIKEARNRIVLMKSDSEDEDFINIRADAEELMDNELDGNNTEPTSSTDQRLVKIINNDDKKTTVQPKKLSLSERLGARPNNSATQEEFQRKKNKISLTETLREEKELFGKIRGTVVTKSSENKFKKREGVHKRLGLPSTVISLPKRNEENIIEEPKKSVMSVVQVKPRRNIPVGCQANKNLLLKAVAEAQKSVVEAQKSVTQSQTSNVKKALFTKNYRKQMMESELKNKERNEIKDSTKLKNIIIEVKDNKKQFVNVEKDNNHSISPPMKDNDSGTEDDFVPSTLDLTYEDDLDKFMEDFDDKSEENIKEVEKETNHQFIVTLDGLKDTNILKQTENTNLNVDKSQKRAPSPIIFNKNDNINSEKPQIPDKLPKVHLPLSVKTKERCKYWPNCRLKDACEFFHPNTLCNVFPLCKFGDKCMYIHPKCKFDASCTRKDCPYSHMNNKLITKSVSRMISTYSQEVCKFNPNCSNPNCLFYHPKLCRFGKYCLNKSDCSFSHGKIPNKEKLTWHSNSR